MALRLKDNVFKALVQQANREMQASQFYLLASLRFHDWEMPGSATWTRTHSDEERNHSLKIFDHLIMRRAKGLRVGGQEVETMRLDKQNWETPMDVWDALLKSERENSAAIHGVMKLARQEDDYSTESLMNWFVEEQMEEEAIVEEIYKNAKEIQKTSGLYRDYDQQVAGKEH